MPDPRSAARTPAARKEPHFRLRYDSPIFASPSRIADHLRPWDDEYLLEGHVSAASGRRSAATPFLPQTPSAAPPLGRVVSPLNPIRPGYTQKTQTLPSRISPGLDKSGSGELGTRLSYSDGSASGRSPAPPPDGHRSAPAQNIRVSATYTHVRNTY